MTRLIATRGLPASGKTTFARRLQPGVVRVNRDDLRRMLHGERLFTQWAEGQVTVAQRAQVEALLRARVERLRRRHQPARRGPLRDWAELAARLRRGVRGARLHRRAAGGVPAPRRRAAGGRPGRRGRRSGGCTSATWPAARCRCRCRRPAPGRPATVHAAAGRAAGDRPGRHRRHGRADRLAAARTT